MRNQVNYNKLVARRGDEFVFCDYTFEDGNFKGATGSVLRPVSQDEYDERTSESGLIDYLGELWPDAVSSGNTEMGKAEWCQYVYDADGDDTLWDMSYSNFWDQLRAIGFPEDEYPVIECTGGGRCFSHDEEFDEVYDADLLAKIRAIETPKAVAA